MPLVKNPLDFKKVKDLVQFQGLAWHAMTTRTGPGTAGRKIGQSNHFLRDVPNLVYSV